ncbi:MAG: branched-chain amino acid ABC transporter permease [Chloroflexota bacterium]|nr:MAG: branched-chain amino acid ABC transporter permease [Chloroflexota bacterium]
MLSIIVNGLFVSMTLMPMAVGFSLIFGILRIANLAHGELFMLGGYMVWFLVALHNVNYWLALLVAPIPVIILGVFLERYVFRQFRTMLLPSLIVSVGLILILQTGVLVTVDLMGQGLGTQRIPSPFSGSFNLLGVFIPQTRAFVTLVGIAALVALLAFLRLTLLGKTIRACAQDPEAASVHGIDINRNGVIVMAIGTGLAALSGGINGVVFGVGPYMGFGFLLTALVAVVVGGMGSLLGTVLGVLIIGFTSVLTSQFIGADFSDVVVYSVLFALLVFRPNGLFGYLIHSH